MTIQNPPEIDSRKIREILWERKKEVVVSLKSCAHCALCADSCFLYRCRKNDPKYMPSHKVINSIGTIYKKKGKVTRAELEEIRDIVWKRCVLCTRCYCPLGIDIPSLISLARQICRSQGVVHDFEEGKIE
ncbi:MAG: (Fe-S)-binding protein [Desulfobacterium sp.]|nr:(Fe-S)-binding protein [Desulfobacterium sp.]